MTKAAICLSCWDVVAPRGAWKVDRSWRWCECGRTATRWQDGNLGLLEITAAQGRDYVMVLGMNNTYLLEAFKRGENRTSDWWRDTHKFSTSTVPDNYLFHKDKRDCWALLIRAGETSDVIYVPYEKVKMESHENS